MKERQLIHLLGDGIDDFTATVPNIHAPEACGRVDQFPAAVVFDDDAMPAPDHRCTVPQQAGH
jgi:hypothetical protein